ncbi:MAG: hypothetical protein EGP80_01925 [Blautia wexlerae]|nr:hypothetical protein [uncultured Blautia sp.]MBD9162705.1 hypothetical protein [Blautia wexlerae]
MWKIGCLFHFLSCIYEISPNHAITYLSGNDPAKMPDSYGQRINSRLWFDILQFIVLEKAWKKWQ